MSRANFRPALLGVAYTLFLAAGVVLAEAQDPIIGDWIGARTRNAGGLKAGGG